VQKYSIYNIIIALKVKHVKNTYFSAKRKEKSILSVPEGPISRRLDGILRNFKFFR